MNNLNASEIAQLDDVLCASNALAVVAGPQMVISIRALTHERNKRGRVGIWPVNQSLFGLASESRLPSQSVVEVGGGSEQRMTKLSDAGQYYTHFLDEILI
ncbi:hypothetical protein BJ138DRAFT_1107517 [Hygrophoropsis aurantiaca]|uniref:Uncharacterized protein n=1 Tax=Hygrophoropsis aurantiaca TaxID=72124 RepID=A0ACB7ZRC2_9AGAM|nr:hypothetical protein BJ138DRAFT_1107517 [Hygrophoropsis aurantiaca]